jgi:hypothetical protein
MLLLTDPKAQSVLIDEACCETIIVCLRFHISNGEMVAQISKTISRFLSYPTRPSPARKRFGHVYACEFSLISNMILNSIRFHLLTLSEGELLVQAFALHANSRDIVCDIVGAMMNLAYLEANRIAFGWVSSIDTITYKRF